jgi:hypothetical protein
MRKQILPGNVIALFLFALSSGGAQSLVIPQVADGGGWQTTLVLTNSSSSAATASLSFFQDAGGGATQTWTPAFLETNNPENLMLPPASTLFLHTPGTAAALSVGWAQLQAPSTVVAYAIFAETGPGQTEQDGTAPATDNATRFLVPFDNTNGFVTAIAVANTTALAEPVIGRMQLSSGGTAQLSQIMLPAQGHMAFALPQQFPGSARASGLMEFYTPGGSISLLALRFNPSGGFTTAPVYPQTGPPIIGLSGGVGTALPPYTMINILAAPSSSAPGAPPELGISGIAITTPVTGSGTYQSGTVTGQILDSSGNAVGSYSANFAPVTVNGPTFTFSLVSSTSQMQEPAKNAAGNITSGSLTVTLTPQGPGGGTLTGNMTLVSTVATISGAFTGTYTATQ